MYGGLKSTVINIGIATSGPDRALARVIYYDEKMASKVKKLLSVLPYSLGKVSHKKTN